ncbi:MAG: class I SAM-dependent methyltransferase [Anaerolineae bacterium]|nr:class I SAM-dependent methyltransferase [Anaerolineae bacterium]NUQ03255.1 class I SAM-dependent methyltransferase [Anaerolineae bacterium]
MQKGERYDSTRQAWQDIWDNASVEVELATQDYARARETVAYYLPYLPKDGIILEAGSGLSAALIPLKAQGYQVIGLDYAENALHISRAYDPSLRLAAGDVHALPFAENSIGAYLSFGVFEHFESGMTKPLAESFRVLRRGGVLVLTIPYPNVVHEFVRWRRERQGSSTLTDETFFESTYTRDALVDAVRSVGYEVSRVIPTSHAFTLWGLGGAFRAPGYYRTSALAELAGKALKMALPWAFNFTTLIIARKP